MESVLPITGSSVACCVTLSLRQIAPGFSGSQKRVKPLVKSVSHGGPQIKEGLPVGYSTAMMGL